MLLRFIGDYTGGRTQITLEGVTFTGREPAEVADDSRLLRHPEFEAVNSIISLPDELPAFSAPRRGRPRK